MLRRLPLLILAFAIVAMPAQSAPLDKYLPPKSQWVVGLNVKGLLDSALFKKHGSEKLKVTLNKDQGAQDLKKVLGFDPYEDVSTVMAAGFGEDPVEFLVIVHGRFDLDKIQPITDAVAQNNPETLKIAVEKTVRFYEFKVPEREDPMFAAFVDDDTLILSNKKDHIFHAIERSNDKKTIKLEKGLQALVDKADSKKTLWAAGQVPESARKKMADNPQAANFAKKVQYAAGYVTVGDSVQTELQLQVTDQRSAEELRQLLETVRPFVSKAIGDNKDVGTAAGPIFDGIKITRLRNNLTFSSKVSGAQAERVIKRLQK